MGVVLCRWVWSCAGGCGLCRWPWFCASGHDLIKVSMICVNRCAFFVSGHVINCGSEFKCT